MSQGGLSAEEAAVVRETKEEYARRGSWVRIFPTEDSWDLYGSVKTIFVRVDEYPFDICSTCIQSVRGYMWSQ